MTNVNSLCDTLQNAALLLSLESRLKFFITEERGKRHDKGEQRQGTTASITTVLCGEGVCFP